MTLFLEKENETKMVSMFGCSRNEKHLGGSWCSIVDVFQTAAIDAQEDYKLKHLVEQFQLSGSLITG